MEDKILAKETQQTNASERKVEKYEDFYEAYGFFDGMARKLELHESQIKSLEEKMQRMENPSAATNGF